MEQHVTSLLGKVSLSLAVLLVGCSAPATFRVSDSPNIESARGRSILNSDKVSEETARLLKRYPLESPHWRGTLAPADRIALAESRMRSARMSEKKHPARALGYYLSAAEVITPGIDDAAEGWMLRDLYNLCCAEIAHLAHRSARSGNGETWHVEGRDRRYRMRLATGGHRVGLATFNSLTPTARTGLGDPDDHGGQVSQRGFGGSLVGYISKDRLPDETWVMPEGLALPLASVVEFSSGGEVSLNVYSVGLDDEAFAVGRRRKLTAHFTAPLSRVFAQGPRGNLGFRAMVLPERYEAQSGLYFLEPFREDKIPIVFVHGLVSAPRTWRKAWTAIYSDEKLRENYQIWVYRYSTGEDLGESARDFRKRLRKAAERCDPGGKNRSFNQMVLVGHSLGGLLSSAMIRSSGDRVWNALFDVPIDVIEMGDDARNEIRELAYFEAQPYITRVVFMATPHRGSNFASNPIGKIGTAIIRVPINLLTLRPPGLVAALSDQAEGLAEDKRTSIRSLEPNSFELEILRSLPIRKGVTYHSIIGDRGRGNTPDSSDGTVPYWSSHLDGAASELVVPCDHGVHHNGQARDELARILHAHLRKAGR